MGNSQHMDDEILKSLCRHTVDGLQQVYFQPASLCSPRRSEDSKELPNLLSLHALLSDYVARADPPLPGIYIKFVAGDTCLYIPSSSPQKNYNTLRPTASVTTIASTSRRREQRVDETTAMFDATLAHWRSLAKV